MNTIDLETIKNLYGKVVYTYTTHEKDSDILEVINRIVKITNIVLITATSSAIVGTIIVNKQAYTVTSAIIASLALAFSIFQLSFNPEKDAQLHKAVARDLWIIKERYINFINDLKVDRLTDEEIVKKRDFLVDETDKVLRHAPPTSNLAYRLAQKALKEDEEQTFNPGEVDKFLPSNLKD